MKVSCSSLGLNLGISNATRALATRATAPIFEYVKVTAKDGTITLTGTDGTLTICSRVLAEVETAGEYLLPGKLFADIIRKLPPGNIKIQTNSKNTSIAIHSGTSRCTLACTTCEEYPKAPEINEFCALRISQRKLKSMIKHVTFAVAQHESREVLTGCLMEVSKHEVRLVAIDGFRLAMQKASGNYPLRADTETVKAVIPRRAIVEICNILSDDAEAEATLYTGSGMLIAKIGKTTVITSLIAGQYINYRQILPKHWKMQIAVKCKEFSQAIDRASLIAKHAKNNLILLDVDNNTLRISSVTELGNTMEEVPIQLSGEPLPLAFNASYISEAVKNIDEEHCMITAESSVSPCVLSKDGNENGDYVYMVLPVRR